MPIVKYGKNKPTVSNPKSTVADARKPNPNSTVYKNLKTAVNKGKKG